MNTGLTDRLKTRNWFVTRSIHNTQFIRTKIVTDVYPARRSCFEKSLSLTADLIGGGDKKGVGIGVPTLQHFGGGG